MNEFNRIETHPDLAVLLDLFLAQPPEKQLRDLRVLCYWEQAPPLRRAIALKLFKEWLTNEEVASLCGSSVRLCRDEVYRDFVHSLHDRHSPPPRGSKDANGEMHIRGDRPSPMGDD